MELRGSFTLNHVQRLVIPCEFRLSSVPFSWCFYLLHDRVSSPSKTPIYNSPANLHEEHNQTHIMAPRKALGTIDSNGTIKITTNQAVVLDRAFLDSLTRVPAPDENVSDLRYAEEPEWLMMELRHRQAKSPSVKPQLNHARKLTSMTTDARLLISAVMPSETRFGSSLRVEK